MRMLVLTFILAIAITSKVDASKLVIKSQPEGAEIFIVTGEKPIRVGATPFEANLTEVMNNYVKSNSFLLEIRKAGHTPYRLLIAKTTEIDLELMATLELDREISNIKEMDSLMNQLFDVQKLIRGKNFGDAILKLTDLEKKHPTISIITEMKGSAYYMSKQVENALSYYRKSFALNPDNHDAYRMKIYLEKKLGVDSEVK